MQTEQINWTGQRLGDYVVEELICEGPFSWVYRAAHKSIESEYVACKISKPDDLLGMTGSEVVFPTQALAGRIGGVARINPDAAQLLMFQSERLKKAFDQSVQVKDVVSEDGRFIMQMEWLDGMTLRDVMNTGPLPIALVLSLAESLRALTDKQSIGHHGDVKPDNIMVIPGGVKLLDPGHFGALDTQDGVVDECIVTTPSYYPLLTPDDLFAVGIICWEAACGTHPMDGMTYSQSMDLSGVSEELYNFVRSRELAGEYFLTPILQAVRPTIVRPDLPSEVEEFLLTALRLRVSPDGTIDLAPGLASFEEMIERLRHLIGAGIREF